MDDEQKWTQSDGVRKVEKTKWKLLQMVLNYCWINAQFKYLIYSFIILKICWEKMITKSVHFTFWHASIQFVRLDKRKIYQRDFWNTR